MKTLVLATVSAAALLVAGAASAQSTNTDAAFKAATDQAASKKAGSPQTSYLYQNGYQNTADIDQITAKDATQSSTVLQYWPSSYGNDGYAGAGTVAKNNYAKVAQTASAGSNQRAVVMQLNYGSYDGNGAVVTQNGKGKQAALSYQFGNSNYSEINQGGTDSNNDGFQVGSVDQHAAGENEATSLHSQDATLTASKAGGVRVVQDESTGSVAKVTQTASSNNTGATVLQWHGYKDTAQVTQSGTDNKSASYQNGANNYIGVNQSGYGNQAATLQVGQASGKGDSDATHNNDANITQSGFVNYALSRQAGNNNSLTVGQSGGFNYSYADQSGALQVANVTQGGNFELSSVSQKGAMDATTVNQSGEGDTSVVDQTGNGVAGLYNTANITQSSANAWSYAQQIGAGNLAIVHQH